MLNRSTLIAAAGAVALALAGTTASAAISDFSTLASGTTTSFTLNGATFSSPADAPGAGAYVVGANGGLFSTLPSTVLSAAGSPAVLDIGFSSAMSQVSFAFVVGDFFQSAGDDFITVTANNGSGAHVASASIPIGSGDLFPQGIFTYSGASFTTLTISAGTGGDEPLVIGNVTAAVPEMSTFALMCTGLLGLVFLRRRA